MELDLSSLHLLADTAALVSEGNLYVDKIREIGGRDVTLVVEKTLTATDMRKRRLSIPKEKIRENFLSEEEILILDSQEDIKVSLIEPCLQVSHGWQLKKWKFNGSYFSYMLMGSRQEVVHPFEQNKLEEHGLIQLWSFRVDGHLWFCLKKVGDAPEVVENIANHE